MSKNISVFYTESARKDLHAIDKKQASRIVKTIQNNTEKNALEKARKLSGIFEGLYRYRIGNYRAIFEYDDKGKLVILIILRIKHRKEVYR